MVKLIKSKNFTKAVIFCIFGVALLSSCQELDCFSNEEYAIKQAEQLCAQANGNQAICESLKIYDKSLCAFSQDQKKVCMATNKGIRTAILIPYFKCNQLQKDQCVKDKECQYTIIDGDPLIKIARSQYN